MMHGQQNIKDAGSTRDTFKDIPVERNCTYMQ
jgi:hypothetical protein